MGYLQSPSYLIARYSGHSSPLWVLGVNYLVFCKEQQASVHGRLDGLYEVWEGSLCLSGDAGVACSFKVVSVRLFLAPVNTNWKLDVSHKRPSCRFIF